MEKEKIDKQINLANEDEVAESEENIKVEVKPDRIIDKDKVYEEGI